MALPQEHVRALDQLRIRLSGLVLALEQTLGDLQTNDPLPKWPELQADALAIGNTMQEVSDALNSQRELFSTLHAYPNSNYPACDPQRQQLLYGLLWKKLPPSAEEWISKSLQDEQNGTKEGDGLADNQMEELWNWAPQSSQKFFTEWLQDRTFESAYTVAEREAGVENVITGLKKDPDKRDEDDSEDDEDEDEDGDKMEEDTKPNESKASVPNGFDPSKPAMPLDSLLRFASGGELNPPGPNR